MPLRDDVENIRDRAIVALNDAHDYFTYTRDAWRSLQQDVQREGRKLSWQNKRLSKRQLTGTDILGLPDKAAMIDALVEKELRDVFYDRPANWFEYIRELVNISSPSAGEAEQFAEIKATRDVLVHGQGVANAYYVDKAGTTLARAKSGQPLDIPGPYHQKSWDLICKLVRDIGTAIAAKA